MCVYKTRQDTSLHLLFLVRHIFPSQHKKSIKGQLFFLLTIFLISAVKFSNQKGGPPLTLPLELPYLPYTTSVIGTNHPPVPLLHFYVRKFIQIQPLNIMSNEWGWQRCSNMSAALNIKWISKRSFYFSYGWFCAFKLVILLNLCSINVSTSFWVHAAPKSWSKYTTI